MTAIERAHRLAGARPGAVLRRRASAAGRRRARPAGPTRRSADGADAHRRARLSAHRQLRRLRSAAAGAGRRSVFVRPGEPIPGDAAWSSCRARRRPSPTSPRCAQPAGTSTSRRMCGAAAGCSASAAATRCSAARIADPHGIEGPPAKVDGLGLLDVDTVLEGDKVLVEVDGRDRRAAACRSRATRCMSAARPARDRRPLLEPRDGHDDGAISADGRDRRLLHPRPVGRRPPAPPLAAAARRGGVGLRLRSRRRRHARPAGRPSREALDCDRLLASARPPLLTSSVSTSRIASTPSCRPQAVR